MLGKILLGVVGVAGSAFLFFNANSFLTAEPKTFNIKKEILTGSTFSILAQEAGVATATRLALLEQARPVYDLSQITAGKELEFVFDTGSGLLRELQYEINADERLTVQNTATTSQEQWEAIRVPIEYTVEEATAAGTIDNSLYETIVNQNLDERLALALAEMFAWQIDFAAQIQKGDSFKVIYEKKYRDGTYSHPGKIIAARFSNNKEEFRGFYFAGEKTKEGYYDEQGNSLQKVFLKAPLQYKYISSGFSYKRFNPILKQFTAHRGIDYAAAQGTPAVTVGDGTVVQAGWNGYYGISVKVRHNEMYTTVYGHFSSLARGIRVGAHVKQGQIVGYVGSTGLSTGPHLHYEMHKFGSLINPFNEKVPSTDPVDANERQAFDKIKNDLGKQLGKI